ncbi:MAG TPA: phage tail tape measure protein, partial [Methanothrix sp.]|nr:phage tail tape measure protein [Methanothrix sp.]
QVAGSLGVAKEEIAGFTEVAAQMAVAFEMPAEQAATAAAKILTAFGQDIDASSMEKLGNVVNTMGDSFAATEGEVLDFVNRSSYLNTTMGQSIPQVAALGTALISSGMSAETASTGIKSFLNAATMQGEKKDNLSNWAKLLGTSVDELKGKIAGDLNGTLAETAQKIAAIQDPTERFQAAVKLAGTEGAPALLKLAEAGDTLQEALSKANSEWENGSSMMKTFEQNSSTLNSQWDIFTNTVSRAGIELGSVLLPGLTEAVKLLNHLALGAIEAGEAIYDMVGGLSDSIDDAIGVDSGLNRWVNDLLGVDTGAAEEAGGLLASQCAGGFKEAEAMDDLAEAPGDALSSSDALAGAGEAGKELAKTVSKEFKYGVEQGMSDLDILALINADSGKLNETFDRAFEYAGKSLRMH